MKTYNVATIADHTAGRIDAVDVLTLAFDSGVVRLVLGIKGRIIWDDDYGQLRAWALVTGVWNNTGFWRDDQPWGGPVAPDPIYYGTGSLVSLDVPEASLGSESRAITVTLTETYLSEGSDVPTNVFDDGIRDSIDEEDWAGRTAILSVFWLSEGGTIVEREQVAVRQMDSMPLEWDEDGNPLRKLVLEEADIIQRDIEGTTSNAEFQALIDPTDKAFEHVGTAKVQKINFGRRPESAVDA